MTGLGLSWKTSVSPCRVSNALQPEVAPIVMVFSPTPKRPEILILKKTTAIKLINVLFMTLPCLIGKKGRGIKP
jgi:hypothetical protein